MFTIRHVSIVEKVGDKLKKTHNKLKIKAKKKPAGNSQSAFYFKKFKSITFL